MAGEETRMADIKAKAMASEGSWRVDVERKLNTVTPSTEEQLWKNASIYQVPAFAMELKGKAFTPQFVSFGPYHHGKGHLKAMEIHKERALLHFLKRARRRLDELTGAVDMILEQLQDSYYRLDEEWKTNRDQFLKLMIFDGCFMLEVLQYTTKGRGYPENDPLFSEFGIHHKMPYIRRDMLMIENQLPLMLLKELASFESPQANNDDYIHKVVLRFVVGKEEVQKGMALRLHVLDLYRQSLLRVPPSRTIQKQSPLPPKQTSVLNQTIRSAFELREAGVRFRPSESPSRRDIRFGRDGILHLPTLMVDDTTECIYLNMIVFEHLHVTAGNEITSYISFMDELINSANDVTLLQRKGITQNALGSEKAVAVLFNSISKESTLDPSSSLRAVRLQVNDYCKKDWNKWRANFLHTYFRNPWACISLLAAALVIVLTVVQTVYSVLAYYQPDNSPAPPPSFDTNPS